MVANYLQGHGQRPWPMVPWQFSDLVQALHQIATSAETHDYHRFPALIDQTQELELLVNELAKHSNTTKERQFYYQESCRLLGIIKEFLPQMISLIFLLIQKQQTLYTKKNGKTYCNFLKKLALT